jgi:hypothetical protein
VAAASVISTALAAATTPLILAFHRGRIIEGTSIHAAKGPMSMICVVLAASSASTQIPRLPRATAAYSARRSRHADRGAGALVV